MPTYAYACTECDHRFEVVQSFDDDALTVCPECEGRLRKLFNAVGIVFKGGGFYRTDSRSSGSGGPEKSSSTPSGDTAGAAASGSKGSSPSSGSSSSSGSSTGGSSTTSPSPAAPSTSSG